MSFLPDWDSIESTSRWSDILFWAGIICLVLLAATEVASHIYGSRSSFLSNEATRLTEAQRQHDEAEAEDRRKAEVGTLQKQLAEADKKAAEALQQQAPRHLSESQKQTLIAALSPFAGQKITIASVMGDAEGESYREDFLVVLRAARWSFDEGSDVSQAVIVPTPVGVQVTINQDEAQAGRVLNSAAVFVTTLLQLGIVPDRTMFINQQVPAGQIALKVGTKPPQR
jgi:hypothetical protein